MADRWREDAGGGAGSCSQFGCAEQGARQAGPRELENGG
jgi:hypothetical protein